MRTLSLVGLMVLLCPSALRAQFVYGTTGLLHMPTGEMQRDKTFMFGCAFLDTEATPGHWSYDTGNYFINITIFPWLEVGYTCTLHKAPYGSAIRIVNSRAGCAFGKKAGGRNGLLRLC